MGASPDRSDSSAASRCSWVLPEWSVATFHYNRKIQGTKTIETVSAMLHSQKETLEKLTPARWMSFPTRSAVFFWLTKTMIGGSNPLLRICRSLDLQGEITQNISVLSYLFWDTW